MAPATARTKRATTNPRSGLQIRRMILLAVVLLTTLRLILKGGPVLVPKAFIHRSAWKGCSANFALRGFSEVRSGRPVGLRGRCPILRGLVAEGGPPWRS